MPLRTRSAFPPRPWIVLAPPMYEPSTPTMLLVPAVTRAVHEPPVLVWLRAVPPVKSVTPPPTNAPTPMRLIGIHRPCASGTRTSALWSGYTGTAVGGAIGGGVASGGAIVSGVGCTSVPGGAEGGFSASV